MTMARPEKNTVDYFPFLCKEGKAMYYIEQRHGNDGFATWTKILRQLATTNFHYLDLSKPSEIMFLSAKCQVNQDTLRSIIKDLCDLGEFDLELWNSKQVLWCQKFVDSIQDAYLKRKNDCMTRKKLLSVIEHGKEVSAPEKEVSEPVKTQRKEKNIKEKKTKVKDKKLKAAEKGFSTEVESTYKSILEYFPIDLRPSNNIKQIRWKSEIEKLNRIDKHEFRRIIQVVKWARQDSFWSQNFLSLMKLRLKDKQSVPYFKVFENRIKAYKTFSAEF